MLHPSQHEPTDPEKESEIERNRPYMRMYGNLLEYGITLFGRTAPPTVLAWRCLNYYWNISKKEIHKAAASISEALWKNIRNAGLTGKRIIVSIKIYRVRLSFFDADYSANRSDLQPANAAALTDNVSKGKRVVKFK